MCVLTSCIATGKHRFEGLLMGNIMFPCVARAQTLQRNKANPNKGNGEGGEKRERERERERPDKEAVRWR